MIFRDQIVFHLVFISVAVFTAQAIPTCLVRHSSGSKLKSAVYCTNNDTYCGEWTSNIWKPIGCKYRDITSDDARKCLANRTVGCIGDSQMRYLCNGLVYLLYDMPLDADFVDPGKNLEFYDYISGDTSTSVNKFYHVVAPTKHIQEFNDFTWQVQHWNLINQTFILPHIQEVLQNKYLEDNNLSSHVNITKLKPIDFAIWNNGLHEPTYFDTEPFGENYYNFFVKQWIDLKDTAKFPVVWMSMNTQCYEKKPALYQYQVKMVDEANYYMHKRLKEEGLPYFDATSVLRTKHDQKCSASRDGLHVHHWVDVARAQILLNHLCDEDNNWVGGVDSFL